VARLPPPPFGPVKLAGTSRGAAAHIPAERPSAPKIEPEIEPALDPDPVCCNQALKAKGFVAVARETERVKGAGGFGKALHGVVALNGHCYRFTSGGRGRGSIPPGLYRVGGAEDHPYLGGKAFALSDVFDPFVKDVRNALFMHVGTRSLGCIDMDPRQYRKVVEPRAGAVALRVRHFGRPTFDMRGEPLLLSFS
jgi:hypothetical protein